MTVDPNAPTPPAGSPAVATPSRPPITERDKAVINAAFMNKACPVMNANAGQGGGGLTSPLGQAVSSRGELNGCLGPNCMWFKILRDEQGVTGADCSQNLVALSIHQLPAMLGNVLVQLGKFRFTPNGG